MVGEGEADQPVRNKGGRKPTGFSRKRQALSKKPVPVDPLPTSASPMDPPRLPRPSRRTRYIDPSPSASPRFVAPAYLPKATPRDLAQAAYWQRLDTIDERLLSYSEQITPDQIWLALRVIFTYASGEAICGGLPLVGLVEFLDAEMQRGYRLLDHGQPTMLPLLWMRKDDLDELEQSLHFPSFNSSDESSLSPPRKRR